MPFFSWSSDLSRPWHVAQMWLGALLLSLVSLTARAEEPSWDNLTQALQLAHSETNAASSDPLSASDSRLNALDSRLNGPDSRLNAPALPFVVDAQFSRDTVHFNIKLASGAYIYQDSIVLTSDSGNLLLAQPKLPQATTHQDSMGSHQVYFDELQFEVPILSAQAGDELILSYQGCDAQGICYPPQNFNLEISQDVQISYTKLNQAPHSPAASTAAGAQPHTESSAGSNAGPSAEPSDEHSTESSAAGTHNLWSLLSTETDGSAISAFITQNLGIGLLLCFLLGIGLDLTPCVLPMLPIFSAMIVARPQDGKSVSFALLLRQNLGYALGLSLCYMVLGLIFAALGASFHGILQHPIVTCAIALLLLVCAAACAGLIELKVPSFITGPLQQRISKVNTKSMGGAFALGVVSAIVASPCTSAPLAGALLYVMQSGNTMMGALVFLAIGLGMATPLLLIGLFGGRFLMKGGMVGDLIKRLLALVLLFAAYYITRHLMGQAEPFFFSFIVFIASLYLIGSIIYFIIKHRLTIAWVSAAALMSLIPTYVAYHVLFQQVSPITNPSLYEGFIKVSSLKELQALQRHGPAFITFTASWCINCRYMAHHIYNQPEFLELSQEFTRIVIDISDASNPQTMELITRFKVVGVPYIVTLDDQGQIHSSHIGLANASMVRDILLDLKNAVD